LFTFRARLKPGEKDSSPINGDQESDWN